MAKIISLYVADKGLQLLAGDDVGLGIERDVACANFADLNQVNPELQTYVTQACKLGLMGYYSNGVTVKPTFDPNAKLTLAEVAITVSRLLRGDTYKGSEQRWYQNHLLALQKANIILKGVDPMQKALRGEVYAILRKIP
jgi:hypothetical protein